MSAAKQGLSHRHVGSLHAADDQMALENARDAYTRRSEGCSIWVVKASSIVASQPEERGEFFDPAESKVYPSPDVLYRAGRHGTYVRQR
ncbi:phenylacetate-CoA oxygenase subunit PaaB [Kluyvera cryocrescens]|uniref:Phenylacetate-CoA oxygenase subunit PaaB n=1 Tax=Kluyvera cryocrescens TaxID=580 RepID=A0A485CU15_KLUCR|nr:phenylacetate-CoA oxygenase subunit PaaB [Kluyvera cryocrescens]